MRYVKIQFIAAISLLLLYAPAASARFRFDPIPWKNEYRKQILQASGVIRENQDKTITYLRSANLVDKPVTCVFKLDDDGQIAALEILKSSGNEETDQKAIAIIRRAAPFKVDPKAQTTQTVHFSRSDVIVTDGTGDR